MRIGIDVSCWLNKRGYGRYTRELVRSLVERDSRDEYTLFLDSETARCADDLPLGASTVVVGTLRAAADAASASGRRSLRDLWAMRRAVQRYEEGLDLFYFPSVYTYFPISAGPKVVVTIHDTTAERYPSLIFPNWRARMAWNLKLWLAVRRADLIATVSEASKRAIVDQFRVEPDAIRVVSDAVTPVFRASVDASLTVEVLQRFGINPGDRYVLYVGGISPHKNLMTLVDAYASVAHEDGFGDIKLVMVGDYAGDVFYSSYPELRSRIEAAGMTRNVVFTGFVPDDALLHVYHAADLLVMPSFDEGFGLPAVEAMACGTPVVASRAGALPEVVGDAGLLFDPNAPTELTHHLRALLADEGLRRDLGQKGQDRSQRFSWERSVDAALAGFREVVGAYQHAVA